jgi:hypothetical protein
MTALAAEADALTSSWLVDGIDSWRLFGGAVPQRLNVLGA